MISDKQNFSKANSMVVQVQSENMALDMVVTQIRGYVGL